MGRLQALDESNRRDAEKIELARNRDLSFRIVGIPKSKGSLSPFIQWIDGKPKARLMEKKSRSSRKALNDWREVCGRVFKQAASHASRFGLVRGRYLQPVAVTCQFSLPRPKSAPSYVEAPTTYPDIDKLTRVILDELRLWILTDDRQIVDVHATKVYADTDSGDIIGAIVRIRPCDPPEKERWT